MLVNKVFKGEGGKYLDDFSTANFESHCKSKHNGTIDLSELSQDESNTISERQLFREAAGDANLSIEPWSLNTWIVNNKGTPKKVSDHLLRRVVKHVVQVLTSATEADRFVHT